MVSHRGLVKRIDWLQSLYPMETNDAMFQKTPYSFGVSEWEFFWPLPYGARLFIAKDEGHKDVDYIVQTFKQHKITHMCAVPSMLSLITDYMVAENALKSTSIKYMFCAGEALTLDTCRKFSEAFDGKLINLYGPTEADMTFWECPPDVTGLTKVPIGLPMWNVKVYILDQKRQPVPSGVPGELYFGGVTTALGYLNQKNLTNEVFVQNPWFDSSRDTNLMYKTGDLARWNPSGTELEFLGRVDHQVKLRGFRIELGEIESVLLQCSGVMRAAVIVHGKSVSQKLVAYVVPESLNTEELTEMLRKKVPEYMVPSLIIPIKEMPLTSRHKLDKKALPDPAEYLAKRFPTQDFVEASTPTQRLILTIWQEVLSTTQPISITSDFASIGGNSLLAGKVTTKIRIATGARLKGTAMYTHATIQKISHLVDTYKQNENNSQKLGDNRERGGWGGFEPNSFRCIFIQTVGLMVTMLVGPCGLIPGWYFCYDVYWDGGIFLCCLSIPLAMCVTFLAMMALTVVLRQILVSDLKPGMYPIWGGVYLRWWVMQNLIRNINRMIGPFICDTPLFNLWFRLLGGQLGKRVSIKTLLWTDPYLISIGDDCVLGRSCVICPHAVENGYLILNRVVLEHHCRVQPRSYVVEGTFLPAGTVVGPLSTTGQGARVLSTIDETEFAAQNETQGFPRILLGVPVLIIFACFAYVPAIYLMQHLYYAYIGPNVDTYLMRYLLTCAVLPWLYALVLPETYYWLVVVFKWVFIGRFRKCKHFPRKPYLEFCRWMLDSMVHNELFEQAMRPWINTEILATRYRILGCSFGIKTHCDYFECVEFDLVSVGRDSVFGSNVTLYASDEVEQLPIVLEPRSQVLDHCLLMPGATVCEGALCGSSTLGAKNYTFVRNSVNTGNVGGKCIQLRVRDDKGDGLSHLPTVEQEMARRARRYHKSTFRWIMFNLFNIAVVLCLGPLPQAVEMSSVILYVYLTDFKIFASSSAASYALNLLVAVPIYLVLYVLETLFIVGLKWVIVGKYKEENHPFYSVYHYKWVVMMTLRNAVRALEEDLNGSYFAVLLLRFLGGHVGKNVCMFGFGLEYDLLHLNDNSTVGWRCDATCHTIENMVIKLAPVHIGEASTLRAGSVVMPGGSMEPNGTLLENSQVLKGETVPAHEVWAGLPAQQVDRPSSQ